MQRPENSRAPRPPALVSIILPVHNAEEWLDECLKSVLQQDFEGSLELSVFDDASKDKSMTIIERWKGKLESAGIPVVIGGHDSPSPRGVGYSKNQAIVQSSGSYLCFLDSDDVMMPQRVRLQHQAAEQHPTSIIGCQVRRDPPDSTARYTRWINQLAPDQLLTQVFTSHGPTVIMPTWFCSRAWFSHVGLFDEGGQGVPEDLLFFYEHLRKGGGVVRVDQSLLLYRYHLHAATHSVLESTIWAHRVCFLEEQALPRWAAFTIWNAGKQGRRLYRSLTTASQRKVVAFCDVDKNKIKKGFYCHEDAQVCGPLPGESQPWPAGAASAPGVGRALALSLREMSQFQPHEPGSKVQGAPPPLGGAHVTCVAGAVPSRKDPSHGYPSCISELPGRPSSSA
ncbi:UDP-GlcNAc:betaGal beta-1,3-N-acetylglucosaminyltransferase-like protein 1 isoform X2 [Cavia porcellus]|uniref:UDP-GlcNAc:betaGal beta-1,3-N-acetylglucosaminyltransferase-like protein 1 isoform X2 n=1 Tax=Cavia porcellus TaxID=10141 RepID=UPI002FE07C2F